MADICKALQARFTGMNTEADYKFSRASAIQPNAKTKQYSAERGVLMDQANKLRSDAAVLELAYKDLCTGKK